MKLKKVISAVTLSFAVASTETTEASGPRAAMLLGHIQRENEQKLQSVLKEPAVRPIVSIDVNNTLANLTAIELQRVSAHQALVDQAMTSPEIDPTIKMSLAQALANRGRYEAGVKTITVQVLQAMPEFQAYQRYAHCLSDKNQYNELELLVVQAAIKASENGFTEKELAEIQDWLRTAVSEKLITDKNAMMLGLLIFVLLITVSGGATVLNGGDEAELKKE